MPDPPKLLGTELRDHIGDGVATNQKGQTYLSF